MYYLSLEEMCGEGNGIVSSMGSFEVLPGESLDGADTLQPLTSRLITTVSSALNEVKAEEIKK